MAPSSSAHSETDQPAAVVQPRRLHGAVSGRVLSRTPALHHLLAGVSGGPVPFVLQRARVVRLLEFELRHSEMR